MFHCEHSQCLANAHDKCKHGKFNINNLSDIHLKFVRTSLISMPIQQVLCDRHFGGINYPVGGVGGIATSLADGLVEKGSEICYKANVTNAILENGKAVSCLYRLEELYLCWVLYLS